MMEKKQSSIRVIISVSFIVLMVCTLLVIGYIIFSSWKISTGVGRGGRDGTNEECGLLRYRKDQIKITTNQKIFL